jgi:hypothetical protein
MRKAISNSWTIAILTVLLAAGIFLTTAAAQKASVPRAQDRLTMGEEPTKELLQVISANGRDVVTKQEYMKFAEAEFDRLDKEKAGAVNVRLFSQTTVASSRYVGK